MSIKKRLFAFYVRQGLTGEHLRIAVRNDMKAVRENRATFVASIKDRLRARVESSRSGYSLGDGFIWANTPQGEMYWCNRA